MLGIFKRRLKYKHPLKQKKHVHPNSVAAWQAKKQTATTTQLHVLKAIGEIGRPCHYRMISQHMHVIDGCVTPRIAELRRKGLVKIAYINLGLNRKKVNYYVLTGRGIHAVEENRS